MQTPAGTAETPVPEPSGQVNPSIGPDTIYGSRGQGEKSGGGRAIFWLRSLGRPDIILCSMIAVPESVRVRSGQP